jgi:hypothetical protein
VKRRLAIAIAVLLAGCARHVVLDPDDVARLNEQRWTVYSQPGSVVVAPPDAGTD